jgi:hypothetical protein
VSAAYCGDGASRALNGGEPEVRPDPELRAALLGIAEPARVSSHDLVQRMDRLARRSDDTEGSAGKGNGGAEQLPLRDLQTAATLACAQALGAQAAAVLLVAEDGSGQRLDETAIETESKPLGLAVVRALEAMSNPQSET